MQAVGAVGGQRCRVAGVLGQAPAMTHWKKKKKLIKEKFKRETLVHGASVDNYVQSTVATANLRL